MKSQLLINYEAIISLENLFAAWQEFLPGKKKKKDVREFSVHLADNIVQLHNDLANYTYVHGGYESFRIADPKPRQIHKATVRDRLLHHAIYRQLYPFFNSTFIADSYSCRLGRGTHKAINRFRVFARQVSNNHTRTCWVLKCDIKKFFASIDQEALIKILTSRIQDQSIMRLLKEVITSFSSTLPSKGLPLGNLTSQLFCNVYMNELDQFIKHQLHAQNYIRYADDFVILSEDREWVDSLIPKLSVFLKEKLRLELHPKKVSISTIASGVDFLGWTHFPNSRVFRTSAKRRMMRRIQEQHKPNALQSYLGLLGHGDSFKLQQELKNVYGLGEPDFESV